ncbi:hypothetical protein ACSXEW_07375 [Clostridium perfringens]|uniref:hypothetical protein n=1 Tax=Clostridium perfringens TaxID=1502 RepID=UPI003969C6FD
MNLNQLKERVYEVCYIKITEGRGYIDLCFEENYNKAIADSSRNESWSLSLLERYFKCYRTSSECS